MAALFLTITPNCEAPEAKARWVHDHALAQHLCETVAEALLGRPEKHRELIGAAV